MTYGEPGARGAQTPGGRTWRKRPGVVGSFGNLDVTDPC